MGARQSADTVSERASASAQHRSYARRDHIEVVGPSGGHPRGPGQTLVKNDRITERCIVVNGTLRYPRYTLFTHAQSFSMESIWPKTMSLV